MNEGEHNSSKIGCNLDMDMDLNTNNMDLINQNNMDLDCNTNNCNNFVVPHNRVSDATKWVFWFDKLLYVSNVVDITTTEFVVELYDVNIEENILTQLNTRVNVVKTMCKRLTVIANRTISRTSLAEIKHMVECN